MIGAAQETHLIREPDTTVHCVPFSSVTSRDGVKEGIEWLLLHGGMEGARGRGRGGAAGRAESERAAKPFQQAEDVK